MKTYEHWQLEHWADCHIPWIVFNGIHSFNDMSCSLEEELSERQAMKIVESLKVPGRNGRLHRTFGDYDAFEFPVELQLLKFEQLAEVKKWLRGAGQLVVHTDPDKYREVTIIESSNVRPYVNEMNTYWKFTVTFECAPFKRTLRNQQIILAKDSHTYIDPGDEKAAPFFSINSSGGDIRLVVNNQTFTLKNTKKGMVEVDCEKKLVTQDHSFVKNEGDFPIIQPGENKIQVSGNLEQSIFDPRSVWL
ncbi:phage tail family protein [Enterococcus sp. BWM-S5]|uniref:Phage tail family protein n=1 Tax=Enterococcus larvae TaxID=2794352 RepID=A0ABS4CGI0_9ENTE|nr:phage tail domain-containing protein [Enterococcus larvae]MBP1045266.1 phage tail family protein [Enterococcus larvae]